MRTSLGTSWERWERFVNRMITSWELREHFENRMRASWELLGTLVFSFDKRLDAKQNKAKQSTKNGHHNNNNNKATNAKQSKASSLSLSLSPVCILFACLLDCCHIASLLGGFLSIHSHQLSSCKIQKRQ